MSSKIFKFEVITPDGVIFSDNVEQAVIPGSEGEFGVLELHSPMVSTLKEGEIKILKDNKVKETVKVTGGIAEITKNSCIILTE